MFNVRNMFYNASVLLLAVALTAAGCGKPSEPPPGAPAEVSAPTIDQGTESGPMDSSASSNNSSSDSGSPQAE